MKHELSTEELELLSTKATDLLRSVGLGDAFQFERLSGGRNNRIYRVLGSQQPTILKWYFHHQEDRRDRLESEWSFYEWSSRSARDFVAVPIAKDLRNRLAVFSCIAGTSLTENEVNVSHVDQAIDFIGKLNGIRDRTVATELPNASEACFSIQLHINCVSSRVDRLRSIDQVMEIDREAVDFVATAVAPALTRAVDKVQRWCTAELVEAAAPLDSQNKCVSPSDFGFHNALVDECGKLKFYDFEYAGWDDPAKLLCDFYCQPEIPAPRDSWNTFADLTAELAGDTPLERQRQALLFPLYQVKWCCILLNEFLPTSLERRKFAADNTVDLDAQLKKAKRLAEQIVID